MGMKGVGGGVEISVEAWRQHGDCTWRVGEGFTTSPPPYHPVPTTLPLPPPPPTPLPNINTIYNPNLEKCVVPIFFTGATNREVIEDMLKYPNYR